MKKVLVILICNLTIICRGQESNMIEKPKMDKRIEIISIACRLADFNEYQPDIFKVYVDKIESHYGKHKSHELISFLKKLRVEKALGYDAVPFLAVHLDDDFNPVIPFTEKVPGGRWGKENAYEFVELLKKFYDETNSEEFLESNKQLFAEAENKFLSIFEKLDTQWYADFYGTSANEEFKLIIGLGIGGSNYGCPVNFGNGKKQVNAIMGTWKTDDSGMAVFPMDDYFPTVVHEFNHSFVNYLLDENPAPFKENGKKLYEAVKQKMKNAGYSNWKTVLNEALVRAAVIKYMKDHNFEDEKIQLEIIEQLNRGFIWIEDLVKKLELYDSQREKYPTLKSFMPELARAYKTFADKLNLYIELNEDKKSRFVSIGEFENGNQTVDAALKQITINFDRPFRGSQFIRPGEDMATFPKIIGLRYSDDNKSAIIEVDLEKDKKYIFYLIGLAPKSEGSKNNDQEIRFKTLE